MEHNNILCIDIVNPYIKLLGITDIMSDSEKKTPTISSDQGATGETASSTEKMDVGTETGLSEEEKNVIQKDYAEGVFGLLEKIRSTLVCLVCPEECQCEVHFLDEASHEEEEKDAQYKKDYAEGIFGLVEEIRNMLVCLICSVRASPS